MFDNIEEYAPGFKQLIVGYEVLTPHDLETVFGLTGGVSWSLKFTSNGTTIAC